MTINLAHVFTSDIYWLVAIAVPLFALVHTRFWQRLTRTQAYVGGVGLLAVLCTIHSIAVDMSGIPASALEMLAGCAIIVIAAGATVIAFRIIDESDEEQWPGMGPKRPTNAAIAVIENAMALANAAHENTRDTVELLETMAAYLELLRHLPADAPRDLPVQQLRRIMAARTGKEKE